MIQCYSSLFSIWYKSDYHQNFLIQNQLAWVFHNIPFLPDHYRHRLSACHKNGKCQMTWTLADTSENINYEYSLKLPKIHQYLFSGQKVRSLTYDLYVQTGLRSPSTWLATPNFCLKCYEWFSIGLLHMMTKFNALWHSLCLIIHTYTVSEVII